MKKEYVTSRRYTLTKEDIDKAILYWLEYERNQLLNDGPDMNYTLTAEGALSGLIITTEDSAEERSKDIK